MVFPDLGAIVKGMSVTLREMFTPNVTYQYPEVRMPVAPRFRGRHELKRHENGLEKCIGCSLCAAAWPCRDPKSNPLPIPNSSRKPKTDTVPRAASAKAARKEGAAVTIKTTVRPGTTSARNETVAMLVFDCSL